MRRSTRHTGEIHSCCFPSPSKRCLMHGHILLLGDMARNLFLTASKRLLAGRGSC